eukprot:CAMPEP_0117648676 /NCGR_PEP_ID=MMETSP0804-20121206/542_1 /TAXON_ID=1074897 /ORGANISM="Tetraselmis astigmatica, Strain CCMP880" /LENGTH=94 /DNA_ID=CAMNT_0005454315 /DNA_START=798 /DNA_END=1079 /DNA_ORIENTATION=-
MCHRSAGCLSTERQLRLICIREPLKTLDLDRRTRRGNSKCLAGGVERKPEPSEVLPVFLVHIKSMQAGRAIVELQVKRMILQQMPWVRRKYPCM